MSLLVKVCGLSEPVTLAAALDAGADMVGLVFHPRSPRFVTPERAGALAALARGRALVVALLVDPDDDALDAALAAAAPDWLQLHGAEPPARVAAIRARAGRPVMKALPVAAAADLAALPAHAAAADRLLLDAKPPEGAAYPGGHGRAFDWGLLEGGAGPDGAALPPFVLSGGLTPGNVAGAVARARPAGVDVSSGVETAPGVKDAALIRAFVAAARGH